MRSGFLADSARALTALLLVVGVAAQGCCASVEHSSNSIGAIGLQVLGWPDDGETLVTELLRDGDEDSRDTITCTRADDSFTCDRQFVTYRITGPGALRGTIASPVAPQGIGPGVSVTLRLSINRAAQAEPMVRSVSHRVEADGNSCGDWLTLPTYRFDFGG